MTTLPEEAVKAAKDVLYYANPNDVERALTAAAPHLAAERVNSDQIEAARKAVEELAHVQMNLPLEDWSRISSAILSALEPSAARKLALEKVHLWRVATEDEASVGWTYLMSDIEQARDQASLDCGYDATLEFTEAVMKIAETRFRALSSPDHADAGKVEGDGWLPSEYEVYCDDELVAASNDLREAMNYAAINAGDGFVELVEVRRRTLPSAPSQEVAGS